MRETYPVNGALACWDLGVSSLPDAQAAFDSWGSVSIKPRSENERLRAALSDYKGKDKDKIIQRMKKRGKLEVCDVERGETHNDYTSNFTASVKDNVVSTNYGWADTSRIQALFDHHSMICTPGQLSAALVEQVKTWHGITYGRSSGGFYWLHEDQAKRLEQLARALVSVAVEGSNEVTITWAEMSPSAARAVTQGLNKEIEAAVKKILDDLDTLQDEEAIEKRKQDADDMMEKIAEYETILGGGLDGLKAITGYAREMAVKAAMLVGV